MHGVIVDSTPTPTPPGANGVKLDTYFVKLSSVNMFKLWIKQTYQVDSMLAFEKEPKFIVYSCNIHLLCFNLQESRLFYSL